MSDNTKRPAALSTTTEEGLPVWPAARIIDGYAYELESTHPDEDAAASRVEAIREAGDSAQAFSSGRPKFASAGTVKGQQAYFAHAAAVYRVPAGKTGRVEGGGVVWTDRPPRQPPAGSKAAKKAERKTAKAAAKGVVTTKGGARVRATPKAAAPAE